MSEDRTAEQVLFALDPLSAGTSATVVNRDGDPVGEQVIYNRALTDDEVNMVGAELARRYGITWVPR